MPLHIAYTLEQCWHDVPGGSAVSALEVARVLARRSDVELIGVAGRHRRPAVAGYEPPIPVRHLPIARPWLYEAWNRLGWPGVERATGTVDVCHSTVAIPAATSAPHVVTVHDLAFVERPDLFTAHGARVMRAGLERCRRADLVICPSAATRDALVASGFAAEGVRVVPWGVAPNRATASDVADVRRRLALPERFVLFVGTLEPRKNLARLAAAVDALNATSPGGDPLPLVVAGAAGWGSVAPTGRDVRFLGHVPAPDLPAVYRAATVFAYPSLQEGFGLPIAEAMAAGVPVVTSVGTATAEVAGDAGVLVEPTDVDDIAAGIATALGDVDRLGALGSARAETMTWDAAAEATLAVYRGVAR